MVSITTLESGNLDILSIVASRKRLATTAVRRLSNLQASLSNRSVVRNWFCIAGRMQHFSGWRPLPVIVKLW